MNTITLFILNSMKIQLTIEVFDNVIVRCVQVSLHVVIVLLRSIISLKLCVVPFASKIYFYLSLHDILENDFLQFSY